MRWRPQRWMTRRSAESLHSEVHAAPSIWLSAVTQDGSLARQLGVGLRARGKAVVGRPYGECGAESQCSKTDEAGAGTAGLGTVQALVFVLSPDSISSPVCITDLNEAGQHNRLIIPIRSRPIDSTKLPVALIPLPQIPSEPGADVSSTIDAIIERIDQGLRVDAFVSYSRHDVAVVDRLVEALHRTAVTTWVDRRELEPSEEWYNAIQAAIERADSFVFLMSPPALESRYAHGEVEHALRQNKRIIPVLLRPVDPERIPQPLKDRQWINPDLRLEEPALVAAIEKALTTDVTWVRQHTRLLVRANEWAGRNRNSSYLLHGQDLKAAEEWLVNAGAARDRNPTPLQTEYITASGRARSRLIQMVAGVVIAVAIGFIVLGLLYLLQYKSRQAADLKRTIADSQRVLQAQRAESERQRAESEMQVGRANRAALVGERFVQTDPAKAIAYAFASKKYSAVLAAQTLIQRAARQLPEYQMIRVENRETSTGPEVMPSNFFGVKRLLFAHNGQVLIVHHRDGSVTTWNVYSGHRGAIIGGPQHPVRQLVAAQRYPTALIVRYDGGSVAEYALHATATVGTEKKLLPQGVPGPVTDLIATPDGSRIFARTREGRVVLLRGSSLPAFDASWKVTGLEVTGTTQPTTTRVAALPEVASIMDGNSNAWAVNNAGELLVVVTREGKVTSYDLKSRQRKELEPLRPIDRTSDFDFGGSEKPPLSIWVVDRLDFAVVQRWSDTECYVEILDLNSGKLIEHFDRRYAMAAVDRAGGKIAIVTAEDVEQFDTKRDAAGLQVKPYNKWPIEPAGGDSGESQAIAYGPFGEWLVTVNAPIMTLVGPPAATVKIWYANPMSDNRAGDPHAGKIIGPRTVSALNCAFDAEGRELAVFTTDGNVRIWQLFPEQAVYSGLKSHDFFYDERYLPVEVRELISSVGTEPADFLVRAGELFRIRLTPDQEKELSVALESPKALESLLTSAAVHSPSTIALQTHNERVEIKGAALKIPTGYEESKGLHDPLEENDALKELIEDIRDVRLIDNREVARRYVTAVEADILLLGGMQAPAASAALSSPDANVRVAGYVMLALTGDLSVLPVIEAGGEREQPGSQTARVAAWGAQFLKATGQDLSLLGPLALHPDAATQRVFPFCLPRPAPEDPRINALFILPRQGNLSKIALRAAQTQSPSPSLGLLALASKLSGDSEFNQRLNLAVLLRDHKAYAAALAWCAPLLAQGKKSEKEDSGKRAGMAENLYGYILHLQGKDAEAIPYYKRSIELGRSDGWPERNWAEALAGLGQYAQARAQYEAALQKVNALLKSGAQNQKPAEFREILNQIKPEIAGFHNALAWHIATKGPATGADLQRALEAAQTACELTDHANPVFLDTLATVQASLHDYTAAAATEASAVTHLPASSPDQAEYEAKLKDWELQESNGSTTKPATTTRLGLRGT